MTIAIFCKFDEKMSKNILFIKDLLSKILENIVYSTGFVCSICYFHVKILQVFTFLSENTPFFSLFYHQS